MAESTELARNELPARSDSAAGSDAQSPYRMRNAPRRQVVSERPIDEYSQDESSRVAAAIRGGDESAFVQLFRRDVTPLRKYAARIVHSDAAAQDVVMDVFARLWRNRFELSPDTNLTAYLRASVRNACLNHLRHHEIESSIEKIGAASGWTPAMSAAPLIPDEELERSEAKEIVRHALAALTPRMRLVLEMRWLGEKSYKEIANELGMQVRSVETFVARALRILREHMRGNDSG